MLAPSRAIAQAPRLLHRVEVMLAATDLPDPTGPIGLARRSLLDATLRAFDVPSHPPSIHDGSVYLTRVALRQAAE